MTEGIVCFIAANGIVVAGAASAVATLRLPGRLDRALALPVLGLAQVVVSLTIAGAGLRRFDASTVLWVNVGLTAVSIVIWTLSGRPRCLTRGCDSGPAIPGAIRAARLHPWETTLVVAAASALAWRTLVAYVLPPYDFDGMWYHLTTVAAWVQTGDFSRSNLVLWSALFPANGELAFSWPVVLTGSDTWVNSVQLGFAALGALAVTGLARVVGAKPPAALAAGALFALTPIVLAQSSTNYVDVVIAATFLTSLYFVLRFLLLATVIGSRPGHSSSTPALLVPAGAAAGFALGTKGSGIVYLGVLTLVLILGSVVVRRQSGIRWSAVLAATGAFVLPTLAVGSFWNLRNLVEFGNPLYPVKVEVLGHQLFPGEFTPSQVANSLPPRDPGTKPEWARVVRSWAQDLAPWSHPGGEYYSEEHRNGGFGMQWVYLELPALGILGLGAVAGRRISLSRAARPLGSERVATVALLLAVGTAFLLNPYRWWSRWTIVLPSVGAVALVMVVQRTMNRSLNRLLKWTTLILVGVSTWFATAAIPANYGRLVRPGEVLRLARAPGSSRTTGAVFLPDFRWVDEIEESATIGVVLGSTRSTGSFSYFFYPLFGDGYRHHIVPVDASGPAELVQRTREAGVDYVFLRNDGVELLWARAGAGDFAVVSEGSFFTAFRVRDPSEGSPLGLVTSLRGAAPRRSR